MTEKSSTNLMSIAEASSSYEAWLKTKMSIVTADLELKHRSMSESPFMFLRATFYRWMQLWNHAADELHDAPSVLAIGDLHIENFGTWRDLDGRLIWGVNDFDETFHLPYALDLVRLATSSWIAGKLGSLKVARADALEALLAGYERSLKRDGNPFVLEERHSWLREIAMSELREPARFWAKIEALTPAKAADVAPAEKVLRAHLPAGASKPRYLVRTAGLGSLGRPRFVALSDWGGSAVCREAKAVAPSACIWAAANAPGTRKAKDRIWIDDLIQKAHRVPDPYYIAADRWIVRRLAPHCSKIDIAHLPRKRDDLALLEAMGMEVANLHLGTASRKDLLRDLTKKRRRQIQTVVERMTELTLIDWQDWRLHQGVRGTRRKG